MKRYAYFIVCVLVLITKISMAQTTLPVEIVSFTYEIVDNKVYLYWTTATETNNAGFNVERKNNSAWEMLDGFIIGAGTSSSYKYYSYIDTTVVVGQKYTYRLKQIDNVGTYEYSDTLSISVISDVVKDNAKLLPHVFLAQNYPNPFNPSTTITYNLPFSAQILLKIFDITGREVAIIVDDFQIAGTYDYVISSNQYPMASGIYFYTLFVENVPFTKTMIILK